MNAGFKELLAIILHLTYRCTRDGVDAVVYFVRTAKVVSHVLRVTHGNTLTDQSPSLGNVLFGPGHSEVVDIYDQKQLEVSVPIATSPFFHRDEATA